jgi:hypothetical protein
MFESYSALPTSEEMVMEYSSAPTGGLNPMQEGRGWVKYHMVKFLREKRPPPDIRGMLPGTLNPVERMFIYTNIIDPVDVNDDSVRLLKMLNTSGKAFSTTQVEFLAPVYLPVKKGKISRIEILITDDQGERVPFELGTVILTLHFRRHEVRGQGKLTTAVYI